MGREMVGNLHVGAGLRRNINRQTLLELALFDCVFTINWNVMPSTWWMSSILVDVLVVYLCS